MLTITICDNSTSPVTCDTQANIDSYIANHLSQNTYFVGSTYVLSTGININDEDATVKFIYREAGFLTFTDLKMMEALV